MKERVETLVRTVTAIGDAIRCMMMWKLELMEWGSKW